MKIKDVMDKFSGKGVPWGPTLTPSAAKELEIYLIELTREAFRAGFEEGRFFERTNKPVDNDHNLDVNTSYEIDTSLDNGYGFEKEII